MTAAESLDRTVVADAVSVGRVRTEFSAWLRRFRLSPARHNDLVLAVNEALANSAEFAYVGAVQTGQVRLVADHDAARRALTVTVTDQGHWRPPGESPDAIPHLRGRGIPLMQALADEVVIEATPDGTAVRMRFDRIGDSVGDVGAPISVNA